MCLVAQSCPAMRNPMDCSLSGSSVHGNSPGKNTSPEDLPNSRTEPESPVLQIDS